MKKKIIANGKEHLFVLLDLEISASGSNCDLNHIDVSQVTSMESLFENLRFNGDISQWDTSKVETMERIFYNTSFNGDISKWNVSNVKNMERAFYKSKFNGDISQWNVSSVENMFGMFAESIFNRDISRWDVSAVEHMNWMFHKSAFKQDLSDWQPIKLLEALNMFKDTSASVPYWSDFTDRSARNRAIEKYILKRDLNLNLVKNGVNGKKLKI